MNFAYEQKKEEVQLQIFWIRCGSIGIRRLKEMKSMIPYVKEKKEKEETHHPEYVAYFDR